MVGYEVRYPRAARRCGARPGNDEQQSRMKFHQRRFRNAKEMRLDETQRLIGRALRWRTQAETGLKVEPGEMSELLALAGTEIEPVSDHLL